MNATTRYWWIRHAPVINPDGRIYGQSDMAADLSDGSQFERLANILPEDAIWVTTTLRRARETAGKLASSVSPERNVSEDDTLREQAFGDWEGARWDDIPTEDSEPYWQDPVGTPMPNGESFIDVIARVTATVERLNNDHSGRDIIAIAHAGSIRAAISHALGGDPNAALSFHITPLSLTRIDAIHRDGKIWWRIAGVNLFGNHG
jgi:alpha-ribazole phosphatase